MAVNVIGQRMNFMVILHGCWLVAILTRRRRTAIAHLWPNYCLFLTLFLLYQYLLCLGIPPALCIGEWGVGRGQGTGHEHWMSQCAWLWPHGSTQGCFPPALGSSSS